MSLPAMIALAVVAVLLIGGVTIYNRLVNEQVRTDSAWSDVDVQLQRRHDLIPNLVETVQGYAEHERETLERVTEARQQAVDASGLAEQVEAEGALTSALRQLFALSEDYPELRAAGNFRQLQTQLDEIEEALQDARRYYNATVRDYNTMRRQFPANLVAGPLGFGRREFFELEDEQARTAPDVSFD